jgi:opacity protein-like surface antigen
MAGDTARPARPRLRPLAPLCDRRRRRRARSNNWLLCRYNPGASDSGSGSRSETVGGWVVGGGFEYAFSQSWSLKAEYLHVELSRGFADYEINHAGNTGVTNRVFVHSDQTLQIARVGLNYKFGSGTW